MVENLLNKLVSHILTKRIGEFLTFSETLEKLIDRCFAAIPAAQGNFFPTEMIHIVKSQYFFVVHFRPPLIKYLSILRDNFIIRRSKNHRPVNLAKPDLLIWPARTG